MANLPDQFVRAARQLEGGRRCVWGVNLLSRMCEVAGCPGVPSMLPQKAGELQHLCREVLAGCSPQMRKKGLRMLRQMLAADEACQSILLSMPRYLRCGTNQLLRQRRLTREDALPRSLEPLWLRAYFIEILNDEKTSSWKSSRTARQQFSLIYKFLRTSGLLRFDNLQAFKDHMATMDESETRALCKQYVDANTRSEASARRYIPVFNLLFVQLWCTLPQKLGKTSLKRKRKVWKLEELDDRLSQSSGLSTARGEGTNRTDNFDEEEVGRLRSAASECPRDNLVCTILLTTGLRRQGVLNIRVEDVAQFEDGRWVAAGSGITLTKGRQQHGFAIPRECALAIERWLNTPEEYGGRPLTPSPFLLPSAVKDNGQLSDTALYNIFRSICKRAGIADRRAHPHAMRHTFAHDLVDADNPISVVQACLGHKSISTTQRYLRESIESTMKKIRHPEYWNSTGRADGPVERSGEVTKPPAGELKSTPPINVAKIKTSRKRSMQDLLDNRQRRNVLLHQLAQSVHGEAEARVQSQSEHTAP